MSAAVTVPDSDLEFDYGTFNSAGFAAKTLASAQTLASVIDHTLLKPEIARNQVEALCAEAARYRFACVIVNPIWVSSAVGFLAGTGVPVGAVLGYPFGASLVTTLRQEASALLRLGAREFDMVLPVGLLKSGNHAAVERTIHSVAHIAHHGGAILKVTIETGMLTMEERLRASEIAIHAGADFIKTCSGFASAGATAPDVALLRGVAGARCGIKASGGIRNLSSVRAMLEAGANRIGTSAAVDILREFSAG